MCQIENLIKEGVLQGVRSMLPVKSILREYLSTDDTDTEAEDDEEDEEDGEDEEDEEEDKKTIVKPKKSVSNNSKVVPTEPSSAPTGPSNSTLESTNTIESLKTELALFNPKEIDISVPNDSLKPSASTRSATPPPRAVTPPPRPATPPPRPATPPPRPATPPAIPTIVLDGAPKVDFNEVNTFFPSTNTNEKKSETPEEVDLNTLEEIDMSAMEESTTLDFTEFEEL
jgi:hypothetical protein